MELMILAVREKQRECYCFLNCRQYSYFCG